MFNFFRRKDETDKEKEEKERNESIASNISMFNSVETSIKEAEQKFKKPQIYDRKLIDDGKAKKNIKLDTFKEEVEVLDKYTGKKLVLTKEEAKIKYGKNWTEHLAEADHVVSLQERYRQTFKNPWLTNKNIKKSSNSKDNLEVVSRKFNNAKRSKSNKEFVEDAEYLKKVEIDISEEAKNKAIKNENKSQKAMKIQDLKDSSKNILETGMSAGKSAAKDAGITGVTVSGIYNITAVLKGDKDVNEALIDTAKAGGNAAVKASVIASSTTTISHSVTYTLSNSSSKFLKILADKNVPYNVITSIIATGDIIKDYSEGKISTQECILRIGEKRINYVTTGYSMALGQSLIPIPIVGAAVGAFVGSSLIGEYTNQIIKQLQQKELEQKERERLIEEYKLLEKQYRKYRQELESYTQQYFEECREYFNIAIEEIKTSMIENNPGGIVEGTNKITKKLGGKVQYETFNEFEKFMKSDDIFEL